MKAYRLGDPVRLREHLLESFEVFEPQPTVEGMLDWMRVKGDGRKAFDSSSQLSQFSPKQFFFPERETLFRFDGKDFTETLPEVPHRALLGVRACDLVAIAYQDRFFRDDPYYQKRSKKTLLVGVDCYEPCKRGFCPSVDAGPAVRNGTADLVLSSTHESSWLVISMTAAGERALEGLSLEPATDGWDAKRTEREKEVVGQFPDVSYINEGIRRINAQEVAPETWETLGIQCLQCSGCTNLCPTCSCYATFETPLEGSGENAFERSRCWDSCLYDGFQREASGENPSHAAGARVQRYWYHKFSDDYVSEFGRYGCVGSGRCENTCVGVIGVHSVMKRIGAP